jgi:hypothetical protein
MKNLKRLASSFFLIAALAFGAFAGETNAPPCVPGEMNSPPGETNSPPCTGASVSSDIPTNPGETSSPPASEQDWGTIAEIGLWMLFIS